MLITPSTPPKNHLLLCFSRQFWLSLLFYVLWLIVVFVSMFDSVLTIQLRDQMMDSELNPMGRTLLRLNSGDVVYFLVAKAVGTLLVASIVLLLYWHRRSLGLAVVAGLAAFQLGLLLFLTLR